MSEEGCCAPADLAKLSKADFIDLWGELKEKFDELGERLAAMKVEFDRRKLSVAEGKLFSVQKSTSSFDGLDIPKVRTEMGPAWCAKRSKEISKTTYKVARRATVKVAEAAA